MSAAEDVLPQAPPPKRLLLIRLDRLGDVVLSTPLIQAVRQAFPHAFVAMLVGPLCREVLQGHPALQEVLVYDKAGRHRGVAATMRFARSLRRYRFDTALVIHPSNRSHWIPWLAGIPVRIGYRRKQAWLLTHRVPHRKHEGERHEADYARDLVRVFGVEPRGPAMPAIALHPDAVARAEALLAGEGLGGGVAPLVALHPSASCVSKRWPPERFAAVADRLIEAQGVRICLIAGPGDAAHAHQVAAAMRQPAINFAGRLSVGELAALLRRCRLLISNDSGPVHVAAAVGTPVVDIFGRNQRGLSPTRWGPIGPGHVVLHKEVGCVTCLAHACDIQFLCLTALPVEEVYGAAVKVLTAPDPRPAGTP